MNIFLISLVASLNLYFLKDSPNLLVRIVPEENTEQLTLYYSFTTGKWDSMDTRFYTSHFDAVIAPPESANIVGFYFKYNERIDDNQGMLYLYEIKKSPRMILPFSLDYLETVIRQARKKISSQTHINEAITIIDYAEKILKDLPYKKGSEQEMKINLLSSEINELRILVGK